MQYQRYSDDSMGRGRLWTSECSVYATMNGALVCIGGSALDLTPICVSQVRIVLDCDFQTVTHHPPFLKLWLLASSLHIRYHCRTYGEPTEHTQTAPSMRRTWPTTALSIILLLSPDCFGCSWDVFPRPAKDKIVQAKNLYEGLQAVCLNNPLELKTGPRHVARDNTSTLDEATDRGQDVARRSFALNNEHVGETCALPWRTWLTVRCHSTGQDRVVVLMSYFANTIFLSLFRDLH